MKIAFRCSECALLEDADERCYCKADINPSPAHREKGDTDKCKQNFELLPNKQQWHEKFPWEKK